MIMYYFILKKISCIFLSFFKLAPLVTLLILHCTLLLNNVTYFQVQHQTCIMFAFLLNLLNIVVLIVLLHKQ